MVRAYHVIFCAYGFWLPNDPRGSWSDFVRSWELRLFGEATKVAVRRSVAGRAHDAQLRAEAKGALARPPVIFSGVQALAIGRGFAEAIRRSEYVLFACAILPEHVHVVLDRCGYEVEKAVGQLKGEATKQMQREGLHPFGHAASAPSPWARRCWAVYLNSDDDIRRAVKYVEGNPAKEGKRPQRWSFVTRFD